MTTGADFLTAILADPDDATVRLVYADWLDEKGETLAATMLRGPDAGRGVDLFRWMTERPFRWKENRLTLLACIHFAAMERMVPASGTTVYQALECIQQRLHTEELCEALKYAEKERCACCGGPSPRSGDEYGRCESCRVAGMVPGRPGRGWRTLGEFDG